MKNIFIALLAGLFFIGCAKPPNYSDIPEIEFIQINKSTTSQCEIGIIGEPCDTVLVTIGFTDGDGDIGRADSIPTLIIKDLRDGSINTSAVALLQIPEGGANNGISGEITFRVFTSCCLYPPQFQQRTCTPSTNYPQDTIVYQVNIVDNAGNESNVLTLDPIYINCD